MKADPRKASCFSVFKGSQIEKYRIMSPGLPTMFKIILQLETSFFRSLSSKLKDARDNKSLRCKTFSMQFSCSIWMDWRTCFVLR